MQPVVFLPPAQFFVTYKKQTDYFQNWNFGCGASATLGRRREPAGIFLFFDADGWNPDT
jgi:hypothetical protein